MYSIKELADDFCRLGIGPDDTVMLHASVRAVGEVAGGHDSIHLALESALTEQGTLMMYASCPRYYDEVDAAVLLRIRKWRFVRNYLCSILSSPDRTARTGRSSSS